jgi:hypothetical protein
MKYLKLCAAVLSVALLSFPAAAQKLKVEEIVTKHLDSIGAADKRAAVKSQIAVGDGTAKFLSQKDQVLQGRLVLASAGEKNFFGMSINSPNYPGERFSFDGKKAKVAYVQTGQRSILGNFLLSNPLALEESLLGGTLSTSWALRNMSENKARLSSEGTKKIDGREVYAVNYSRKGSGDLTITLFFDKETFRHVRTEYKRTSSASIGRTVDESARMSETRLKVVEDFSDFRDEKGLTLPHGYRLVYSITGQNGTTEIEWSFKLSEFAFNQTLEEKTFDAEAN